MSKIEILTSQYDMPFEMKLIQSVILASVILLDTLKTLNYLFVKQTLDVCCFSLIIGYFFASNRVRSPNTKVFFRLREFFYEKY